MSEDFVTVVEVEDAPFVTVVEVEEPLIGTGAEEVAVETVEEEEVQLYRLPGERLGFGLKFDGGSTVLGLTIESTAEGSPSARARASWGPLGPGDGILAVDGEPVTGMTRQEVVRRLTESGLVVRLRVRRGPPPVPPRRQARKRPPGPPPPPRPLPRAPPRLVDFLPKEATQLVDSTNEDSSQLQNTMDHTHKIEINDGRHGFICKDTEAESQADSLNFEDNFKEKISPLKNLNPKLVSLFEYSQPSDTNIKTSHIEEFNNKLWTNDEKCRKSVKDKIALFSNELENNFENKFKKQESNEVNLSDNSERRGSKKFQTSHTNSIPPAEVNKNDSYSKTNISKNVNVGKTIPCQNKMNTEANYYSQPQNDAISNNMNKKEATTTITLIKTQDKIISSNRPEKKNKDDDTDLMPSSEGPLRFNSLKHKTEDTSKYCFLNNVMDHRKKSASYNKEKNASKLRGLVIPENLSRVSTADQIFDLPEIKSVELFSKMNNDNSEFSKEKFQSYPPTSNQIINISSNGFEWKPRLDHEFPKYSPAFKRKAFSVFEIQNHNSNTPVSDFENEFEKPCSSFGVIDIDLEGREEKLLNDKSCLEKASEEQNKSQEVAIEDLQQESLKNTFNLQFIDKKKELDECKAESNPLTYFNNTSDNHSTASSITSETAGSHCSEYSCNIDPEKNKELLECKFDSLLSKDMSDSGNHSIPSNYSKSKSDSCDESMCSLVNGEIQNSDDSSSLNSSSDEGQFIELNYKNTNSFDSKNAEVESKCSNGKTQESLNNNTILLSSDHVGNVDESFTDFISYLTSKRDVPSVTNRGKKVINNLNDKSNNLDTIQEDSKKTFIFPKSMGSQEGQLSSTQKSNEYKENSEDISVFKNNYSNKIQQKCSTDPKNCNTPSFLSGDHNIEEHLCPSLSSPNSDLQRDSHFASITSLASSTSLISQQELCQLIEESNDTNIEDCNGTPEISVIVLHRDTAEGSIGITLAGGVDYECKDITVHKVLSGSPADRDGRIKKGHRILSINGKSMKGLTHLESLTVLKAPRHEVVLVVARSLGDVIEENIISVHHPFNSDHSPPPPSLCQSDSEAKWGSVINITLVKEGAGLGFSLKGGKDSPSGDLPLTVQKIFTGGCAEKSRQIFAGDELLSINDFHLNGMTRVEAWAVMKRLPDGEVLLKIRHPV